VGLAPVLAARGRAPSRFARAGVPLQDRPCGQALPRLELASPIPIFAGPAFATPPLLPKDIGTFAEMLIERTMLIFVRPPLRLTVFVPKRIGPVAHGLFEAEFRFGTQADLVIEGLHTPAPALMHLRDQAFEFRIGDQLPVRGGLQGFGLIICIADRLARLVQRDGVRMNDAPLRSSTSTYLSTITLLRSKISGLEMPFQPTPR